MRKKTGAISVLLVLVMIAGSVFLSCQHHTVVSPEQEIKDTILAQVDAFHRFIKDTLQPEAAGCRTGQKELRRHFLKARLLFKKFEWAAAYFTGATTQLVNGPPVQEVENADLLDPALTQALDPSGLQVIEELLFPRYDTARKDKLVKQLDLLESNCEFYQAYFTSHTLSEWRILDAAKLEVFRILTLGITGFDNPLTLNSMHESATSLKSLKSVLSHYAPPESDTGLIRQIDAAVDYLRGHTDFDSFNRAAFITKYANKITSGIAALQQQFGFPVKYNRMLRQEAKTLFDTNAFNVNAFAPGPEYHISRQKVALGKRLFYDAALSGTGTRSCASCHQPDKAFTDGLARNTNIHGKGLLPRNTPTLLNAALQSNLFYDMRALTLEDQARDVIENKAEMEGSMQDAVNRLRKSKSYRKLFAAAFPQKKKKGIDSFEVVNALGSYVRSLTRLNSRFDQYMRGDTTALTTQEIKGFNLFMGKAKCATCHYMPLFNGMVPPKYIVSDAEVIGVPADRSDTAIDPDLGWYNIIGIKSYKHAFKTPTVRNAARTAPYMHNGVFTSLKEVIDFYNNGGGAGMGLKINNQTLSSDSLHLSDEEINEVIAFIKSLNSR